MKKWISRYSTDIGIGAVAATEQGVCQVWLPGDNEIETLSECCFVESELSRRSSQQLEQYFNKSLQQFDLPFDISTLTMFRQHILQMTTRILYGSVITYGSLAAQAGIPAAARAVGGALAANPVPVLIPCHRVIALSGSLTGYSGAGGIPMKKFLLSLEGVDFKG